jgi:hypothetical protein
MRCVNGEPTPSSTVEALEGGDIGSGLCYPCTNALGCQIALPPAALGGQDVAWNECGTIFVASPDGRAIGSLALAELA